MGVFVFELSMPGVNSWNGRWTGEEGYYAKTRNIPEADAAALRGYYSYNFGDGWRAGVTVRRVDGRAAAKIRKKSSGFCGYDWMIDSILRHGDIRT